MGMAWMWQLTVPGYIATSLIFASWHGIAELVVPARPLAGDRPPRRPQPGRGAAVLVPVRRGAARQPRHRPGRRSARRHRPGRWRDPHHVGRVPGRLRRRCADLRRCGAASAGRRAAGVGALAPPRSRCWRSRSSPRAAAAPGSSSTSPRCRAAASRARGRSTCRPASSPTATSRRPATIEPDESLDLVVWPENVIDTVDFATSEQLQLVAAEAARLGVPFAVGITEDVPGQPGRITNAQVVVTPDGRGDEPLRQGAPRPVRRVRAAARPARGPRRAGRPGADERDRGNRAGGDRPARRHPPGGGDLVGGVLRRPGSGGREARRGRPSSTRPTAPATPARSCRPSRSRRAGCGRSRPDGGWCRCRRPGSPRSSRPTAT